MPLTESPGPHAGAPISILLVEDFPPDAQLTQLALTGSDGGPIEIVHVETLTAARERLATAAPDAVLLDLCLPDSLGEATLAALLGGLNTPIHHDRGGISKLGYPGSTARRFEQTATGDRADRSRRSRSRRASDRARRQGLGAQGPRRGPAAEPSGALRGGAASAAPAVGGCATGGCARAGAERHAALPGGCSLRVVPNYPESAGLEDHLIMIKRKIKEFRPNRVAVDSLSALERLSTVKGFREFVIGLTSFIKHEEITGLFTATTSSLLGGDSVTETHISTITDSIILRRYVEMFGEMQRGIAVLKMRGSPHDKEIRSYSIDSSGTHIGEAFRNVNGILAGNPRHMARVELERLDQLFQAGQVQRSRPAALRT